MAVELQFSVKEIDGCKSIQAWDSTGDYNALTNPNGWGAPNRDSSTVKTSYFRFYPEGYTIPILFTFTNEANAMTEAIITFVDGTTLDIFNDITNQVFPIVEASEFIIKGEWLGFTEGNIPSGAWYMEYEAKNDGDSPPLFDYVASVDQLFVCATCCCIQNMKANIEPGKCECDDDKIWNLMRAQVYLDSAIWAMEQGEVEISKVNHAQAKAICEKSGCGCGC